MSEHAPPPNLDTSIYSDKIPDGVWETDLEIKLKTITEHERLVFLNRVLLEQHNKQRFRPFWLGIASRCLTARSSFKTLMDTGLQIADASEIRQWLLLCATKIGIRRTLQFLTERRETNPIGVRKAEYWLHAVVRTKGDAELVRIFKQNNKDTTQTNKNNT